ncbi:hypothetical protein [Streptodolium elevatio]
MADDVTPPTALLRAAATRWVDTDGYPYVVEAVFDDADGWHDVDMISIRKAYAS